MEKLTKKCEQCGVLFDKPYGLSNKMWLKRRFCTMKCSLEVTGIKKGELLPEHIKSGMKGRVSSRKGKPSKQSGEKHYNWKGGEVEKKCQVCQSSFFVRPNRRETAKFCSPKCKNIAQDNGISTENEKVRRSKQYKQWRTAVYERDNYICQICFKRGGALQADHIKPFATHKELRFQIDNGRTLCVDCHKNTPTFGGKMKSIMKTHVSDINL